MTRFLAFGVRRATVKRISAVWFRSELLEMWGSDLRGKKVSWISGIVDPGGIRKAPALIPADPRTP